MVSRQTIGRNVPVKVIETGPFPILDIEVRQARVTNTCYLTGR